MTEVAYSRYEDAYRAIHSALNGITAPPPGKRVTKLTFTWNTDGSISTLSAYDNAELLFTLTFTWNDDGTLQQVARG
ncbi:MAG: hypothetical protein NWF05_08475 [Candidatus Bathyarchaeota archaeon]|nr:hypothetical protein [Candidatus Bathyarchaeota archaeon]